MVALGRFLIDLRASGTSQVARAFLGYLDAVLLEEPARETVAAT